MKHIAILFGIFLISACSDNAPKAKNHSIYILTETQFLVGSEVVDFNSVVSRLDPDKTKQIDISACPNDTAVESLIKMIDTLKASGYSRIGLTADSLQADRELCANYALKGTSV